MSENKRLYESPHYPQSVELESLGAFGMPAQERYERETDFVLRNIDIPLGHKDTILDLACGSGEHAFRLAEKTGANVDARDISAPLIDAAHEKQTGISAAVRDRIRFSVGDMANLQTSPETRYRLATILGSSFMYLGSPDAHEQALKNLFTILHPGGHIAIQFRDLNGQELSKEKLQEWERSFGVKVEHRRAEGPNGKFGKFTDAGEEVTTLLDTSANNGFYFVFDLPIEQKEGLHRKIKENGREGYFNRQGIEHRRFRRIWFDGQGNEENFGETEICDYMSIRSFEVLKSMLKTAGFVNVELHTEPLAPDNPWQNCVVVAEKPAEHDFDMQNYPKYPYSVDDVPAGKEGIAWLLQHRDEVFPWTEYEITCNQGRPASSEFCAQAGMDYLSRLRRLGQRREPELERMREFARREAAKLLGCASPEIAFVPNTTTGVNIVADSIPWKPGDEIIMVRGDQEAASDYLPFKNLLSAHMVRIIEVGDENGIVNPEDISKVLTDKTRLVTITSVGWNIGQRRDIEAIGRLLRDHNQNSAQKALFHVDGVQSVGAFPLDVKQSGIDMLSCGASKWLLAEAGTGIFYCDDNVRRNILKPHFLGLRSLVNWRDPRSGLKDHSGVFEIGTQNMLGEYALGPALTLIDKIGIQNIGERILQLTDRLCRGLESKGYLILSPRSDPKDKSGIVIVSSPRWQSVADEKERTRIIRSQIQPYCDGKTSMKDGPMDIADRPIFVPIDAGNIRFTLHYYNTEEEVDEIIRRLPDMRQSPSSTGSASA